MSLPVECGSLEQRRLLAIIGPDFTYGDDGLAPLTSNGFVIVGLQDTGKLVILRPLQGSYTVDRRLTDGALDSTFAFPKVVNTRTITSAMDGQDRIVLTTQSSDVDDGPIVVRRYSADGVLQTGYTTTLAAPGDYQNEPVVFLQQWATAVDSQGRTVVLSAAGYNSDPDQQFVRLYADRLLPDGGIDTSFGDRGRVELGQRSNSDLASTYLRFGNNDRLIVTICSAKRSPVMTAYAETGAIDTTFGSAGSITVAAASGATQLGLDVDDAGRAVVFTVGNSRYVGMRYLPSGAIDPSFNSVLDWKTSRVIYYPHVSELEIAEDGRMVGVSGDAMFQVNADGTPDTSFDNDGIARLDGVGQPIAAAADGTYALLKVGQKYGLGKVIAEPGVFLNLTTGALQVSGTSGNDTIRIEQVASNLEVRLNTDVFAFDPDALESIAIVAGDGADQIYSSMTVPGTASLGRGDDDFNGANGVWTVWGDDGADTILTVSGNDFIYANRGSDLVLTGAGNDTVYSVGGNDTINAGEGDDLVRCATGVNTIDGGPGRDTLRGGEDVDFIQGGGGRDRIFGNGGNDNLTGGGNLDRLNGGPGADFLFGESGDDILVDQLAPGETSSVDTLWGGSGNDQGLFDDEDEDADIESLLPAT